METILFLMETITFNNGNHYLLLMETIKNQRSKRFTTLTYTWMLKSHMGIAIARKICISTKTLIRFWSLLETAICDLWKNKPKPIL
jgi:hypothetical protein